ncbi:MAG: lamin tail domain-containing protein [Bacteroidales bacterium]|nr:lamin tail domain-containing protein [Bacteroidales bacterium]
MFKILITILLLMVSLLSRGQVVLINEVASVNRSSYIDDYGEFEDWIELYNPGREEVDLAGWFISDDEKDLTKWQIPSGYKHLTKLYPYSYIILWADHDTLQGPLHVNFELSKKGEEVVLSKMIGDQIVIIDRMIFPALKDHHSYGRCPDGGSDLQIMKHPTPGTVNICHIYKKKKDFPCPEPPYDLPSVTKPGMAKITSSRLVVNELVARNAHGLKDEAGEDNDWVEIYNPGTLDINIAGWYVSDTLDQSKFHRIPASDVNKTRIPAGGYLILWADGQPSQGVTHLPFKLNNGGEEFYLAEMQGNSLVIIDQVIFPKLQKDTPYGRYPNGTGGWRRLTDPTPGAANQPPRTVSNFVINELMGVKGSGVTDEFGEEEDWIEFYNPGTLPVDLGGVYLTDSLDDPVQFRIQIHAPDSTTIPPGGYLLFFADNDVKQGIRHLGFKLAKRGERVASYQPDGETLIQIVRFPFMTPDASFGSYPDGSGTRIYMDPTPGSANNYHFTPVDGIIINEFMADNLSSYPDNAGEFEDWIELYNSNSFPVNVGGLYITDSLANPLKFRIQNSSPDSTTIPAGGFLTFWADNDPQQGVRHLDIKLAGTGEEIGLTQFRTTSVTLDAVQFGPQTENVSMGRYPDGSASWMFFAVPTPNAPNGSSGSELLKTSSAGIEIFPNPFTARFDIKLHLKHSSGVQLSLYQMNGKIMYSKDFGLQYPGDHLYRISLPENNKGTAKVLVCRISGSDFVFRQKLYQIN